MRVVLSLAVLVIAATLIIATTAEDVKVRSSSYNGVVSVDLISEGSLQSTLDGILKAVSEALKKAGIDVSLSRKSEQRGKGQIQGTLNFSGARNPSDKVVVVS